MSTVYGCCEMEYIGSIDTQRRVHARVSCRSSLLPVVRGELPERRFGYGVLESVTAVLGSFETPKFFQETPDLVL